MPLDPNDPAPPGSDHLRQEQETQRRGRDDIHADRGSPLGRIDARAGSQRPHDRRVVDQHVHLADPGAGPLDGRSELTRIADVDRDHQRAPAVHAHLAGDLVQLALGSGQQYNAGTGLRQAKRDRPPDAPARSGHQRGLTVQATR